MLFGVKFSFELKFKTFSRFGYFSMYFLVRYKFSNLQIHCSLAQGIFLPFLFWLLPPFFRFWCVYQEHRRGTAPQPETEAVVPAREERRVSDRSGAGTSCVAWGNTGPRPRCGRGIGVGGWLTTRWERGDCCWSAGFQTRGRGRKLSKVHSLVHGVLLTDSCRWSRSLLRHHASTQVRVPRCLRVQTVTSARGVWGPPCTPAARPSVSAARACLAGAWARGRQRRCDVAND